MPAPFLLSLVLALPTLQPTPSPTPQDGADDQYHFIVGLAEKGLKELVVKEATSFLTEHATHPKADLARYRLANALFDLERAGDARAHFARLYTLPEFQFAAEVAFRYGQCELERGEHEVAAEAFDRVIAGEAAYLVTPATFLAGEAAFRQNDFEGAARLYARVLAAEDAGDYAKDAAHGLAWCAFRLDAYDEAVARAGAFLERFPDDARASELLFLRGEAHLEAGRADAALADYSRVSGGAFHDAAVRGAGFATAALGRHGEAARWFGRVLGEFPRSRFRAEAALQRGIHLFKAGEHPAALDVLRSSDAGEGPEALYWRARALAKLERPDEALRALDRALEREPDSDLEARLQVARGDVLFDLGRGDEAAGAYQAAGSDYALHAAAVARLNDGDAAEAVRLARRVVEADPPSPYVPEARLTLAEGLFLLEDYAAAEVEFRAVEGAERDAGRKARAVARMGWCRWLAGDHAPAAEHFERVAREFPQSPEATEARFLAARAREELGDADSARAGYEAYLARSSRNDAGALVAGGANPAEHRAEALLRLARLENGQESEARLAQLLSEAPGSELAPQARLDLAERLAATERWSEARGHYRALVEAHTDHALAPAARYGLAWCLYSEGEHGAAANELRALAADGSAAPELTEAALELCVWAARKADDADLAAAAFAAFAARCENEPRRFAAGKLAASALSDAGRGEDALKLLGELLARTKDRGVAVDICVERAWLLLDAKAVDAAEEQARAAHRYAPDDPDLAEVFFFVGEARFEAGEDAPAAAAYARAAAAGTPQVAERAHYKEGFAHLRAGELDAAGRAFHAVVTGFPAGELYGESLFLLGEAHFRAGRYGQAAEWLERLRAELPQHAVMPKALFRLGVALARTERWREAAERLSELARSSPDFPNLIEADLWRGRALSALDQRRGARQVFERVVKADRGVLAAQARIELGRLALDEGRPDDALSEFLKVAVLYAHPEEVSEALYMAGQVLESQGDPEKALAQYAELLTKHPKTRFATLARERVAELEK